MIKIQIIGHLGRDAEVHVNGTSSVINFSLAHTEKFRDKNGVQNEKTTWIACAYWTEKTAIANYLKKGTQVYIEGFPGVKLWEDRSGNSRAELSCRVLGVQLLGSKKEGDQQPSNAPPPPAPQNNNGYTPYTPAANEPIGDDDLPF